MKLKTFVQRHYPNPATVRISSNRGGNSVELEFKLTHEELFEVLKWVQNNRPAAMAKCEELKGQCVAAGTMSRYESVDLDRGYYWLISEGGDGVLAEHFQSIAELLTDWVLEHFEPEDEEEPDLDCYFSYGWCLGDAPDIQRLQESFVEVLLEVLDEYAEAHA